MSGVPDNLDELLRAVEHDGLDRLAPEQVARLEAVLNDDPRAAARLGEQVPTPDARLARALAALEEPASPSEEQWARAWDRVGAAADTRPVRAVRWLRWWQPLAAAAACFLLAAIWKTQTPAAVEPWPMELATNVEINSLEVYGDATPFVVSAGAEDGVEIIWVLEEES